MSIKSNLSILYTTACVLVIYKLGKISYVTYFIDEQEGSEGPSAPPPRVPILSISGSFGEILAKSYVGALPWRVGGPTLGKSWIRHCPEMLKI